MCMLLQIQLECAVLYLLLVVLVSGLSTWSYASYSGSS